MVPGFDRKNGALPGLDVLGTEDLQIVHLVVMSSHHHPHSTLPQNSRRPQGETDALVSPRAVVTQKEIGYLTGVRCIIGGRGTSVKLDRENVLVLFLDSLQEKSYYIFISCKEFWFGIKKAA